MKKQYKVAVFTASALLACSGFVLLRAQEAQDPDEQGELKVEHAECSFFGPHRERLSESGLEAQGRRTYALSALTQRVTATLASPSGRNTRAAARDGGRTNVFQQLNQLGTIDRYLFQAMQDAGAIAADRTNDYEFIRRVSLDLTGRVPTAERVVAFVTDTSADKRARLVDELLDTQGWIDKWTMYFGDLFKNTIRTTQVNRYPDGRDAFYRWIHDSIASDKHYNDLARELITAAGVNTYEQGELNWMVGGLVTGGPRTGQDNFDQQAANIAETFLGISHVNCLLCHDGRRHLDTLSLWGKNATRYEAWEFASFLSHTSIRATRTGVGNSRYYSVEDNRQFRVDYPLNTTTGNRPARQPLGAVRSVKPRYPFTGRSPEAGENYREVLAQEVTNDFQFARAAVNYIWKEFFGRGLVEPTNQFDPARLDPDNPPPAPWTMQPSNPRLLNALAQDFINSGYDLKALMKEIVTSESYQLSSRYNENWNPEWEPLFARKFVRRLWAEEIHDAIAQTSNVIPRYNLRNFGEVNWAMQFPEPRGSPASAFLDRFLRGDRNEEVRRPDGSSLQALSLMNDNFVVSRARATGAGTTASLVAQLLSVSDEELVNRMFLTVLSRYPTDAEKSAALAGLESGARRDKAEDLLWTLYNKVDFIFNY